jgi:hypothetical protein
MFLDSESKKLMRTGRQGRNGGNLRHRRAPGVKRVREADDMSSPYVLDNLIAYHGPRRPGLAAQLA